MEQMAAKVAEQQMRQLSPSQCGQVQGGPSAPDCGLASVLVEFLRTRVWVVGEGVAGVRGAMGCA